MKCSVVRLRQLNTLCIDKFKGCRYIYMYVRTPIMVYVCVRLSPIRDPIWGHYWGPITSYVLLHSISLFMYVLRRTVNIVNSTGLVNCYIGLNSCSGWRLENRGMNGCHII